jgi:phosphoenolpyruvate carboxykinase (ATP)
MDNNRIKSELEKIGIVTSENIHWNCTPEALIENTIKNDQGTLTNTGALNIKTGKFTGRSPKDRYIVKDSITQDLVHWGEVNIPVDTSVLNGIFNELKVFVKDKNLYVHDGFVGSDTNFRMSVRVIGQYPWSILFAYNMFIRPNRDQQLIFNADWTVISIPEFTVDKNKYGLRQSNFSLISFSEKLILIGGSGYTGEIKKGIFSVMNFVLPVEKNVFPMHCSANDSTEGSDVAIFFGLSGTGKTTLSADPGRILIGDDEHGWSDKGVFNFEGGCYAKVIDLDEKDEPEIFHAIRHGALLENVNFHPNTRIPDYTDDSITQNTRVSYPLYFINNARYISKGDHPKNIFFLTADAFGVLPPLSRLDKLQAEYFFMNGYTSKIAGTEVGIVDPKIAFSTCFGEPFMPLHPIRYADMLGEKMDKYNTKVWLVNTGWIKGPFGKGHRIPLKYTRALIHDVLDGKMDDIEFMNDNIFNFAVPNKCPGVPSEILNPRDCWADKDDYDKNARKLVQAFNDNFAKYKNMANKELLSVFPQFD